MKKFCYLLSIAGHTLLLFIALSVRFPVTIRPEPPRAVVVRIAEPPFHFLANGVPAGSRHPAAKNLSGARPTAGMASGANAAQPSPHGVLTYSAIGDLSLKSPNPGTFRLAPAGRSPDPWATPIGPAPEPRRLRYPVSALVPGAAWGGHGVPGGVFLIPFDVKEKTVAAWTEAALSRIERNWFIPTSARLAFSGRVQITLTIEKSGRQQALAMDDSTLPESVSQSALHAIQASLPLPPLPENVLGESFAFTFVFIFNG